MLTLILLQRKLFYTFLFGCFLNFLSPYYFQELINLTIWKNEKKYQKMETILEDQRRLHEERDRLIDTQAKELLRKKPLFVFLDILLLF